MKPQCCSNLSNILVLIQQKINYVTKSAAQNEMK